MNINELNLSAIQRAAYRHKAQGFLKRFDDRDEVSSYMRDKIKDMVTYAVVRGISDNGIKQLCYTAIDLAVRYPTETVLDKYEPVLQWIADLYSNHSSSTIESQYDDIIDLVHSALKKGTPANAILALADSTITAADNLAVYGGHLRPYKTILETAINTVSRDENNLTEWHQYLRIFEDTTDWAIDNRVPDEVVRAAVNCMVDLAKTGNVEESLKKYEPFLDWFGHSLLMDEHVWGNSYRYAKLVNVFAYAISKNLPEETLKSLAEDIMVLAKKESFPNANHLVEQFVPVFKAVVDSLVINPDDMEIKKEAMALFKRCLQKDLRPMGLSEILFGQDLMENTKEDQKKFFKILADFVEGNIGCSKEETSRLKAGLRAADYSDLQRKFYARFEQCVAAHDVHEMECFVHEMRYALIMYRDYGLKKACKYAKSLNDNRDLQSCIEKYMERPRMLAFIADCLNQGEENAVRRFTQHSYTRGCEVFLQDVKYTRTNVSLTIEPYELTIEEARKYNLQPKPNNSEYNFWLKDGAAISRRNKNADPFVSWDNIDLNERRAKWRHAYKLSKEVPVGSIIKVGRNKCTVVAPDLVVEDDDSYAYNNSSRCYQSYKEDFNKEKPASLNAEVAYEYADLAITGYGLLNVEDYMYFQSTSYTPFKPLDDSRNWWLAEDGLYVNGDADGEVPLHGVFGDPSFYFRPVLYIDNRITPVKAGQHFIIKDIGFTVQSDEKTLLVNDTETQCRSCEIQEKMDKLAENWLGIKEKSIETQSTEDVEEGFER